MADAAERIESGIQWLTDEEAHAIFDAQARKTMGMSGEEFLRRYDAGEFADIHRDGENTAFIKLEMLIPWGR